MVLIQAISWNGFGGQIKESLAPDSAYAAMLEIYSGDILKLKDMRLDKLKAALEMEEKNYSKSNVELFCSLPVKDQFNLEIVRQVQLNALSLIGPHIKTISQVNEKVLSVNSSEQMAIINKFIEGGRLVRKSEKVKNGFLPFCWQITLLSLLDSPFVRIADEKKTEILKMEVIPSIEDLKLAIRPDNLWLIDFQLYCNALLCVLETNLSFGYKAIEEFSICRERIFGKNHANLAIPYYCRLALLMKEKKYEEVVQIFKKIPKNWLESPDDFLIHHKIKFAVVAADAYTKLENKELAKMWREVAFSYSFTLNSLAGKNFSLQQSVLLRNLYLEEKSWGLMRNLEERCARIGMNPLPKQPGE